MKQIPIKDLKPAEYNPRKWDKTQKEQLKKSIEKFGFVDPIIVNSAENRKNIVIGGHFRLKCAKELGMQTVPVVYVNIENIEDEKELNIRLNANVGEFDLTKLKQFFDLDFLKKELDLDFLNQKEEKEIEYVEIDFEVI